jgi:succinate dehydrogenase / fumarate reductase cytochrome b subunit
MTVHLLVNASVTDSPSSFQRAVYQIHSLGSVLPVVEWGFIFLPILFHGILGVAIIAGGKMNYGSYRYGNNLRYTLQRVTGVIAFLFIIWHVFHMHGWFHSEFWLERVAEPYGGHQFRAYSAPSTLGAAMSANAVVPILYAIGVMASVFHFANGIWTMGITWGVWTSPGAQRRANWVCGVAGLFLAAVGMSALFGAVTVDQTQAVDIENRMYESKVASGEIAETEHKRVQRGDAAH